MIFSKRTTIATILCVSVFSGCMAPSAGNLPRGAPTGQGSPIPENPQPASAAQPTASTHYSTASGLFQGVTYDLKPGQMNYATTGIASRLQGAQVKFTPSSNSGILTLNGLSYQLQQVGTSPLTYSATTPNGKILVQVFTVGANAFVAYVGDDRGTNVLDGYMAMGANTNPDNMPSGGIASYAGVAVGYLNQADGTYSAINGNINFVADFDNNTIAGTGSLSTATGSQPVTTIVVEPAQIVGNTFGTTPEFVMASETAHVDRAIINGDFYGPQGQDVAGTFAAEGTDELGDFTVQGAFHTD